MGYCCREGDGAAFRPAAQPARGGFGSADAIYFSFEVQEATHAH